MIKLTLTEKGGEPKVLTFDKDEITIGRVSGNDIVLAKGNISKRHSRLTMRGGEMEIADLKSTNGTYVNGRKITGPTPIAASDRVYVGDFLIGIEGPGVRLAGWGDFSDMPPSSAGSTSAGRRMPVPPPPPPPARRLRRSQLPDEDETWSSSEDEEDVGLRGARRARDARSLLRRRPRRLRRVGSHPLASRSFDIDDDEDYGGFRRRRGTRSRRTPATSGCLSTHAGATPMARPAGGACRPARGRESRRRQGATATAFGAARAGLVAARTRPRRCVWSGGVAPRRAVTHILITALDAALVDRGSGLCFTTPAWATRTPSPTCSGATPTRLSAPGAGQPGCRRPASRRNARLGGVPAGGATGVVASIRPTVYRTACSRTWSPAPTDVQALLDALSRPGATSSSSATWRRCRRSWRHLPATSRRSAGGRDRRNSAGAQRLDRSGADRRCGRPAAGRRVAASRSPGRRRAVGPGGRRAGAGGDPRPTWRAARDARPTATEAITVSARSRRPPWGPATAASLVARAFDL